MTAQPGTPANNAGAIIKTQTGIAFVWAAGGTVSGLHIEGIKFMGTATGAYSHAIMLNDFLYGYTPHADNAVGLQLNLDGSTNYWGGQSSGSAISGFCKSNGLQLAWAGGSLIMAANTTNYVYLDKSNACAPASNTTGFNDNPPIATVTTNATQITNIRSWTGDAGDKNLCGGIATCNTLTAFTNLASGHVDIVRNYFQDFGDFAVVVGNSVVTYDISDNVFYRNNGAIDVGLYADGTVKENQLTLMAGATQSNYRIVGGSSNFFTHNVSDRISSNTTQPDVYIITLAPGGLISINDNKFGSENLGTNTCRIYAANPALPTQVNNGVSIIRNNFLGVANLGVSKVICIASPIDGWNISQNQFNAVSTVVDDAQPLNAGSKGNSVLGPNTYTATTNMILCTNGCVQFTRVEAPPTVPQESLSSSPRSNEMPELRNRITYSEDFTRGWVPSGVTVTPGQTDPFGTTRATDVRRDGSAANQGPTISINMTGAPAPFAGGTGQLVAKFWAKAGDKSGGALSNQLVVCIFDNTVNPAGCVGGQPTYNLSNSWRQYKFVVAGIRVTDAFTLVIYPGGQFQTNLAEDVYLFGVQVSDSDTDYVPTSGSVYADSTGNRYERKVWAAGGLVIGPSQNAPAVVAGTPVTGKCVQFDAAGNLTTSPSACGGGGGGSTKLDYQKAAASWTGNSADQTLYSTALPMIPAGACIRAKVWWVRTAGSGGITFKWWLGTTSSSYASITNSGTGLDSAAATFCNDPAGVSAQIIFSDPLFWGSSPSGGTIATPTENLGLAGVVLKFTANAASTETMNPKGWLVELVQ
jgi:hypothetical protein